jgi:hypothetical protein
MDKIGDGIFRYVNVRRELSWYRDQSGNYGASISVGSRAELFFEPGETPRAPCDFGEPLLSMPLPYGRGFTRAQWEEIKREGDAAFADFDARFAAAVKE